jgi:transcriptional regulator with XRE-family HTH domain
MAVVHRLTFGHVLARHRLAAGLTQEALATGAGMSVRGVSELVRGARRAPYRETLARLSEVLGLVGRERERCCSTRLSRRRLPAG